MLDGRLPETEIKRKRQTSGLKTGRCRLTNSNSACFRESSWDSI